MKRIRNNLISGILLWWTLTAMIFWTNHPGIIQYPGGSLHAAAGQILHGAMLIGIDLLVLSLGRVAQQQRAKSLISDGIQSWMIIVLTGIVATLVLALHRIFSLTNFYQALFPLLHNTYPLLSGVFLGLLIMVLMDNHFKQTRMSTAFLLWLLLIIPFVFGINMFHWNSGNNPLLYTVLFLLGDVAPQCNDQHHHIGRVVFVGIAGLILMGLMPAISTLIHSDSSTAARFTTLASPLLVYVSWAIIQMPSFQQTSSNFPNLLNWLSAALALTTNPAMKTECQNFLNGHAGSSTTKLLVVSFVLALAFAIAGGCWDLILTWLSQRCRLNTRLHGWIKPLDLDQPLPWISRQRVSLQQWLFKHRPTLIALIVAYCLSILSFLLMNNSWRITPNVGSSHNIFLLTFFQCQPMIILTTIILFAFNMFLWAITRHYFVGVMVSDALMIIWIFANWMKIRARNEPVMPSELKMVSVWGSLIQMTGLATIITVIILIIILIAIIIVLERQHGQQAPKRWASIAAILILPLILLSSVRWNHQSSVFHTILSGSGDDPMFYNQLSGARVNGPVVQFLNNIDITVMNRPHGYSKAAMIKIRRRYQTNARQINEGRTNKLSQQTIIFNLSESLANPRRVPGVHMANNPLPKMDRIKQANTSGLMISSGYGGGTANMEYMTLTGFALANFSPTLPTPYTQLVGSLANNPSIVGSFKHSTAIHPYLGTFYNREQVYQKFGFQRFYHLNGSYPIRHQQRIDRSPYLSDQTAYANVMDQLKRQHHGQFIQLVTMQNHFPYTQNFYNGHHQFKATADAGTNVNALEDYSVGIHHTDSAVKTFLQRIDRIQRPITIVFYGDHLPGGIYGNSLQKDGLKLHETDYFIYSNRYARNHGAHQKMLKTVGFVDPNDFIAMVAQQTNSKVDWYQAMLTHIWKQLPAFALNTEQSSTNSYNTNAQFINQHGKIVNSRHFNKQQKQLWHDYQLVQYDVTAGHHYLIRNGQLK